MAQQRSLVQKKTSSSSSPASTSHGLLQKQGFGRTASVQHSGREASSQAGLEPSSPFNFAQLPLGNRAQPLQPKLTIGQPNDKYEQEADRVAHQVVQQIQSPQLQQDAEAQLQRQFNASALVKPIMRRGDGGIASGEISEEFEQSLNQARSGGALLDQTLRPKLEASMGADFSGVKIHTDTQADQLSQSIQAKAFTTGQDVFFKQGEYNPSSRGGQELIAHELTHVVQQNSGTINRSLVQRDAADGKPAQLGAEFTVKAFQEETSVTLATRGEYLKTIDSWIQAVEQAQTWEEQQHALVQARAACNAWLKKHGTTDTEGEPSSVTKRRSSIANTYRLIDGQLAGGPGSSVTYAQPAGGIAKGSRHQAGRVREGGDGIAEAIGGTGGSAGDFDDANAKTNHGKGAGVGDAAHSDFLDGANILGGISSMQNAYKDLTDEDASKFQKADAVGQGVKGAGQATHGGMKTSRGVASLAKGGGDDLSSGWKGTGELGAAIGDSTAAFAGLISTARGMHDFIKNYKETTTQEKVEQGLDVAENAGSTAQAGVKVGLGIYKTSQEFAGASASAETVSSLGSAAAILGLITGSIQIVQGGFQIYRGFSASKDIENAEQEQHQLISGVRGNLSQLSIVLDDPFWRLLTPQPEIDSIIATLQTLEETLQQLQELETTYAPAMAAMKKISSRRMEDGAMKAAGGALGVAGSALTLSGVGAPIALAIGALAGILALGHAGVNLARNAKAGDLTTIATRLTSDGKPKGEPDDPEPSYREMEKRIYKCYYSHIPQVLESQAPAGLKQGDFTKVKQFAWEDKKSRVESLDKVLIGNPTEANQLSEAVRWNKWVEVQDASGTATHKEKPKGFEKVSLTFSASAHKSKQSLKASKEDIASALTMLGMQSYDSSLNDFVNAPIIPQGVADPEMLEQYGQVTLKTLLSTAGISAARWEKWMQKAITANIPSADLSSFMHKQIMNHI